MHIQHIAISVSNLEKSIDFYSTVTGLAVSRGIKQPPFEVAFLTNGDGETEIELIYNPDGQKFEGKGLFICFKTEKLDEMHSLVTEKGLNPSPVQVPGDGTRYFYVYDPDGLSVQLRTFPDAR